MLNDRLRVHGAGGKIMMTSGVASLDARILGQVMDGVRRHDQFTADNDPYGEHDFGQVRVEGFDVMWKIDYYDHAFAYASPDPADAGVTQRVLTVMLAAEY